MELMNSAEHGVYLTTLADKFGSLGIAGIVITERREETVELDSVVMSCRAMGFGLEYVMLREALEAERPWARAIGRYVPTARNNPCAGLFSSAGFAEGDGVWTLDGHAAGVQAPAWIDVRRP